MGPVKRSSDNDRPAVMLVDDHPMWRETLRKVLEHKRVAHVVGEAADGDEAVSLATQLTPDIVVMDIDLPGINGVEATRRIVAEHPATKVLVLSASDARAQVLDAVRAGASGYLVKTAASTDVAEAVRRVHVGEAVFPPLLAEVVLDEVRRGGVELRMVIRVVVAADSVLRREGLARLLEEAGFDVAGSGHPSDLPTLIEPGSIDVALVDAGRGATTGLPVLRDLRRDHSEVGLLVLSEDPGASDVVELLEQGSRGLGYLLTERVTHVAELSDAVRRVAKGESVIEPDVVNGLVNPTREASPIDALTDGERKVLALMAEGRSNQAISEQVFLSPKTVEARVASIFSKLGLEPTPDDHRRVLAVVAYLRAVAESGGR